MQTKRIWAAVLAATLSMTSSVEAQTEEPDPAAERRPVESFVGAYQTAVDIAVPSFHGLEPDMRLIYDSQAGDGALGRGWTTAALSFIERVSPGRGAPDYGPSDTFLLDGRSDGELIACPSTTSAPSCTSGGTHASRIENYLQFVFDPTNDRWTITTREGTKLRYGHSAAARHQTAAGTFRWYLEQVEDTRGNQVDYQYWTDPDPCGDVYLETVSYNGTTISLHRVPRPEIAPSEPQVAYRANGSCLTRMAYLVGTIDVQVGSARARAYALAYSAAPASLTSVTMYGNNAALDGSGAVLSGTAAPAVALSYAPQGAQTFGAVVSDDHATTSHASYKLLSLDLDGDGMVDMCGVRANGINLSTSCVLSSGDGSFGPLVSQSFNTTTVVTYFTPYAADVDGDGSSDICIYTLSNYGNRSKCMLSNGDGSFGPIVDDMHSNLNWSGYTAHFGDISGDGKTDICAVYGQYIRCVIGQGDGTFGALVTNVNLGNVVYYPTRALRDFDGDGRADLCALRADVYGLRSKCFRSLGNGTFEPEVAEDIEIAYDYASPTFADLNGDGKVDLCAQRTGNNQIRTRCALGRGDGSFVEGDEYNPDVGVNYTGYVGAVVDVGGDGLDDYCFSWSDANGFKSKCMRGWGDGTFDTLNADDHELTSYAGYKPAYLDIDGNGAADLCAVKLSSAGFSSRCVLSDNAAPGLLVAHTTSLGGSTTIEYAPSSAWSNTFLPVGMVLQTVSAIHISDGRGGVTNRAVSYAGGLWSQLERRFLGFRKVTTALDAAGTYQEIYFCQPGISACPNVATAAKPEQIYLRNASSQIYWHRSFAYGGSSTAPYIAPLTNRWELDCGLGSSCRSALTQYSYDAYGNVTLVKEHGDTAISGDERTTQLGYAPKVSKYIVSLSSYRSVREGLGTTGTLRARSEELYDGATSYTTQPLVGNPTSTRAWLQGTVFLATTRAFDGYGNVIAVTNPLNHTTTLSYDESQHLYPIEECNALGHCTEATWNAALAVKTSETDANGETITYGHDVLGRRTSIGYPGGGSLAHLYVNAGNPGTQYVETRLSDGTSNGLWSRVYLDGLGRDYKETREGSYTQLTVYNNDAPSLVAKRSSWFGASETAKYDTFAYDGAGRLTSTLHADNTSVMLSYGVGIITRQDEEGDTKTTYTDAWGRLSEVVESNGNVDYHTDYSHDRLGRLVSIIDAAGKTSTFAYDALGRRVQSCDPDRGCWQYDYNDAGSLVERTDAKGQTIVYSYDAIERPIAKTGGYGWSYDQAGHGDGIGRLTTRTFPTGSDSLQYDNAGRLQEETLCRDSICYELARTYDGCGAGRLASIVYPLTTGANPTSTETVSYSYNAAGELAAAGGYATALAWTARGQLKSATFDNGVAETYSHSATRYRLVHMDVKKGTTLLFSSDYQYAPDGQIAQLTVDYDNTSPKTTSFLYDDLNRLVNISGAQSQTLSYDALGNITYNSRVGAYAYTDPLHAHAVTSAGTKSYAYDANGSMVNADGAAVAWDIENRVASHGATSFAYDADGERVRMIGPSGTTRYFGPLLERKGSTLYRYVFAGGRRIARVTGSTKHFFHQDQLSSTRVISDASGVAVRRYDYRPFGEQESTSGTQANSIGFSGHRRDDDTGLLYMGARYYDPLLGRFLSADSIVPNAANPQDLDRYGYVRNNPLRFVDPTGHALHEPTPADLGATPDSPPQEGYHGSVVSGGSGSSGGGSHGGGLVQYHSATPADLGAMPSSPPQPGYSGSVVGWGPSNGSGVTIHGNGPHNGSGPIGPPSTFRTTAYTEDAWIDGYKYSRTVINHFYPKGTKLPNGSISPYDQGVQSVVVHDFPELEGRSIGRAAIEIGTGIAAAVAARFGGAAFGVELGLEGDAAAHLAGHAAGESLADTIMGEPDRHDEIVGPVFGNDGRVHHYEGTIID